MARCSPPRAQAAAEAFDTEPKVTGSGGTIPLLTTLQRLAPDAEFIIWGPGDERSQVHAANESLDLGELERMIVAEALLLEKLGEPQSVATSGAIMLMLCFTVPAAVSRPNCPVRDP